ncbi:hypothetical protein [Thermogutta sp.]|uniref:hypothetical protein n=1 Tax=Thermogutta sp. TaxID=1962930 RepID=UPI00321F8B33
MASQETGAGSVTNPASNHEISEQLVIIRRMLRRMVVTIGLLCLAVFLLAASVFGYLVNYFSFDPLLVGGVSAGAAVIGFLVGLFVGRR